MTFASTALAYVLGLPLGVLLVITDRGGLWEKPLLNSVLGTAVNFLRSVPFIILIIMLFPLTRLVVGTTIGSRGVIMPLVIGAFPFIARMVESSLREVDVGVVEAAQSMGSTTLQIIYKVVLPEAFPSLVNGVAICTMAILGYTAMAGAVGGGGLGKIAIDYGLHRNRPQIMYAASIALVVLVQLIQMLGTWASKAVDHRRK